MKQPSLMIRSLSFRASASDGRTPAGNGQGLGMTSGAGVGVGSGERVGAAVGVAVAAGSPPVDGDGSSDDAGVAAGAGLGDTSAVSGGSVDSGSTRSEERRVGKGCGFGWPLDL